MAMFQRTISQQMRDGLGKPGSAMILYGPRQAGKTTLVNGLLQEIPDAVMFIGDDLYTQSLLARHELEHLKRIVGSATTIFIDEAQRIENIGLTLKLLVDHLPVTVIASGSASFELGGGGCEIPDDSPGNRAGRHAPLRHVSPRAFSGE